MKKNAKLDEAWSEWYETLGEKVVPLMQAGEYNRAILEIDAYLARAAFSELRSDALGFRAQCKEKLGDFGRAKEDLLAARSLTGPGYAKYVHEVSIAQICIKQGQPDDGITWYKTALETCLQERGISGGTALKGFLSQLSREGLSQEDRRLCARVIERSWGVLELPGEPVLGDLNRATRMILDGQVNPPKRPDRE